MEEVKLNYVLIGKARCGKTTTGNAILNKKVFNSSSLGASATRNVQFSSFQFEHYLLHVVDTPSIIDPGLDYEKSVTASKANMETALSMCYGGVDAFLLVLQFPCHFTSEDRLVIKTLKKIFGDKIFKHVIVLVLTYGDLFHEVMTDEGCYCSFDDWCKKQVGEFRELYDDCAGRFMLFNNIGRDAGVKQHQIQKLLQISLKINIFYGRYTIDILRNVEADCSPAKKRKVSWDLKDQHDNHGARPGVSGVSRNIRETEQTILPKSEKIRNNMRLLVEVSEGISVTSTQNDKDMVLDIIDDLMNDLQDEDLNSSFLMVIVMEIARIEGVIMEVISVD